ncbi:hypothetical protein MBLNU230_g2510t1 [Neophaeotheca triangularis]
MHFFTILSGFATAALAQNISFEPGTGTRSLWIPFKTATNLEASILNNSGDKNNQTTYVVSCATPAPQCDIGPNLTLTQGPTTAMYRTENAAGWADLRCSMNGTESAVCKNLATDSSTNFFERRTTTLTEKQPYVAVHVTATMDDGDDETPATASASATAEPTETDD